MSRQCLQLLLITSLISTGLLAACSTTQVASTTSTAVSTSTIVPAHPGTIAFSTDGSEYVNDVYTIQTDGTGLTRLTETNTSAEATAWSPDGSKIAYMVCPQGPESDNRQYDIWIMNADGSEQKQLTQGPLGGTYPAWSPDGTQIAYSTWYYPIEKYGPAQIYVMNADGSNPQPVTKGSGHVFFPQWTPDGKILFLQKIGWYGSSRGDVFSIFPDGSDLTRLTTIEHVGDFALSPDGTKLAIYNSEKASIEILPVNESGAGSPEKLINTGFGYDPVKIAWSPDGEALLFSHHQFKKWGLFDLHLVNADGSDLTTIPNAKGADAAWQP